MMDITLTLTDVVLSDEDRVLVLASFAEVLGTARDLSHDQGAFTVLLRFDPGRSDTEQYRTEVTVQIGDTFIRGEAGGVSLVEAARASAILTSDHLARYQETLSQRVAETGELLPPSTLEKLTQVEQEQVPPTITKRKQFSYITPLTEAEAIERMNLIGHTFFLFLNAQTNRWSVVYKREDGQYGLIEPALPEAS